jgi:hypothetical protein
MGELSSPFLFGKNMNTKVFDITVIISFIIMLILTLNMWTTYDKLKVHVDTQKEIIRNMSIEMNDLYVDNENLKHQLLDCRTLYKEY